MQNNPIDHISVIIKGVSLPLSIIGAQFLLAWFSPYVVETLTPEAFPLIGIILSLPSCYFFGRAIETKLVTDFRIEGHLKAPPLSAELREEIESDRLQGKVSPKMVILALLHQYKELSPSGFAELTLYPQKKIKIALGALLLDQQIETPYDTQNGEPLYVIMDLKKRKVKKDAKK